jgi:two-component system CitB family response regulator
VISVVVVDDDFRVAQVHAVFVRQVPGMQVVGLAHTAADARSLVAQRQPDLVLLDQYLPDGAGVALATQLNADVFMVTADASAATVRAAFAAGALNYLIKPFTGEQLTLRLRAYMQYRTALGGGLGEMSQQGVDRAVDTLHSADRPPSPKGQSAVTARLVTESLQQASSPQSAADIADLHGIARATAQRYLAALTDDGRAMMTLRYGSTGRPEHQYAWARPG